MPDDTTSEAPSAGSQRPLPSGVVTFLLTDIERSTELWELYPAQMDRALSRHDGVIAAIIGNAGGNLLKARGEGDSTFSVFAKATDALTAAVAIQRAFLHEEWPAPTTLRVRASIHTGESIERDGDYFGTTVNRAARLRSLAGGGEIIISQSSVEVTRQHLPPDVRLVELGTRPLAGSQRPERVHRVHFTAPPARGAPEERQPPVLDDADRAVLALPELLLLDDDMFIGRDAELATLRDAWNAARNGARQVVLVAGEPGIGKTSLVARLARIAHQEGAIVLAGRCDEDYDVPYQPFIEALSPLLHHPAATVATHLEARLGGELARILPDAAEHLVGLREPVASDPATERYRLFEAVGAWLVAIAEETPIVLVLDDLQWATTPTLLMLNHVARFTAARLLVVATYRQTELRSASSQSELVARLHRERGARGLELAGIAERDVAEMVERAATPGVEPPSPHEIHVHTGGNALFVRELLRTFSEVTAERSTGTTGPRPWLSVRMRDVVLNRVHRLPAGCRQLLDVAAVLGPQFTLAPLLAIDEAALSSDQLLDALDDAIAARLIVEVDDEADTYRFAHAVVREAIESSLPTSRRLRLHLAVARALEKTTGDTHLAQLSYHFSAALPLGGTAEAIAYGRQAGARAMSMLAFEEAIDHYTRALETTERAGLTVSVDQCDLLLDLARAHAGAGLVGEAAAATERAAVVARVLDLPEHFARAALCFEGEIVTGGKFWESRLLLLEEANDRLADNEGPVRVRVIAMLAHIRAGLCPGPEVDELSATATDLARDMDDDVALAAALQARHHALAMPYHASERAELATRIVAHGEAAGATAWMMLGKHARLADLLELGDLRQFDRELDGYVVAAQELRRPHDLWRAHVMRAMQALFAGRVDEGEQLSRDAYALGNEFEQPGALQTFIVQAFFVAWQRSGLEQLLATASEWADSRQKVATWRAALAVGYAELGKHDEARELIGELSRDSFTSVPRDNLWLATLALTAEACWRVRQHSLADVLEELLAPHATRNATISTALALGVAARPLGLLHALRDDFDAAVVALDEAVMLNRRMGASIWEDMARSDLVRVLRARGRPYDIIRAEAEELTMQRGVAGEEPML